MIAFGLAFTNFIPPFFYWISMLLTLVMGVVGIVVQDIWEAMSTGFLATASTLYPITNFILSNYAFYFIFVLIIIGVGTYVKTSRGGAGAGFA